MPSLYKDFMGKEDTLQNTVFNPKLGTVQMNDTVAGAMMLARAPKNFTQLFMAFVDAYQGQWTWNPRTTSSSGSVCDGEGVAGQCASLSRALLLLARAPKPYGLALGSPPVELAWYYGAMKLGFVSVHRQTYFNLQANVLVPGTIMAPQIQQLYYWGNHYVVKYLGRYYDPSYSKPGDYVEYTELSDMAEYEIIADEIEHKKFLWEKATSRSGKTVYFKRLDNVVVGGRSIPVEGPFDALP